MLCISGEGNGKPLQHSCPENPMNSRKRQKDVTLKDELLRSSQKWQNHLCSFPRQPFNITLIQVCAPTTNAKETEVEQVYNDLLQDLLELTPKRCPFYHRRLECKSRKSKDPWSNRQVWSWSTKWSKAKASRVLPRERTGHSKRPLPTTHEKILHVDIIIWSILK